MRIGDPIPSFRVHDQDWNKVDSSELIGKPCVIYFYPKDDTPGCTKEACAFRDQYEVFIEMGAQVFGVSSDSEESHRKFQERYDLPFRLLCDKNGKLRKSFGVPKKLFGLLPGRVTYIFNEDGKLIHQFDSQSLAVNHIKEAIEALEKMSEN